MTSQTAQVLDFDIFRKQRETLQQQMQKYYFTPMLVWMPMWMMVPTQVPIEGQ
jgi:hypothetical protein